MGKYKDQEIQKQEFDQLPKQHEVHEIATTNVDDVEEEISSDHAALRHRNRKTTNGDHSLTGAGNGSRRKSQIATEEISVTIPEQLPGVFSKETFQELANFKDGITVSVYIPTQSLGGEVNEHFNPTAFRNILNSVEQKLKEKGLEKSQIELLLKPGFELIKDEDFWIDLKHGLGLFIANGFFKYVKMPVVPNQKIVIESTFYVTPLVTVITSSEYFYLLTISKKTVKLFRADAFGMQIVPIDLSQEMGVEVEDGNDKIATYFEAIDDVLWEQVFNKENVPLLLAGVEYEIPIYKSVCDYHNVWPVALTGNREYQETTSLYNDAREVMQLYFDQKKLKALEMYGNKSASAFTSSIVDDVIPATYYGRVSHLFVSGGEHVWGTFDEMENKLAVHENVDGISEDLIDNAVVKTLANGGEVFVLSKEEMPVESSVAAIMRY